MSAVVAREGNLWLRPAHPQDIGLIAELLADPASEPFLAASGSYSEQELAEEAARGLDAPRELGRLLIELDEQPRPVGALAYERANTRSRIAYLHAVTVDPALRGRRIGERASRLAAGYLIHELGFHRVQLEVYGFNVAAQRMFERAGFRLEGRRRLAYWRHGAWQDGVLYGLVEEDITGPQP